MNIVSIAPAAGTAPRWHNEPMQASHFVVLFAHGARDARWGISLENLSAAIVKRMNGARVYCSFLELQTPRLPQVLETAAAEGARRIDILPVFWAGAGHVDNELPSMIASFCANHPGIEVRTLPVLSELPGMLGFIAGTVDGFIQSAQGVKPG